MRKVHLHILYNNTLSDEVMTIGKILSEQGFIIGSTKKLDLANAKKELKDEKAVYFFVFQPSKHVREDKLSEEYFAFLQSFRLPYVLVTELLFCDEMPDNALDILLLPVSKEILYTKFKVYKPLFGWITRQMRSSVSFNDVKEAGVPIFQAFEENTLVSQIGDEMRAPLSGIENVAALMTETELTVDQKRYVDSLNYNLGEVNRIVQEIMEYSLLQQDQWVRKVEDFNLREWMNTLVSIVEIDAIKKNISLDFSIDPNVPEMLSGDYFHLSRVMMLLLDNAIKYTIKGKVEVAVFLKDDLLKNNTIYLHFVIRDTGVGMSDEKLAHLFDSKMEKKSGGLGLGLSMIQSYLSSLGGHIQVESEEGLGSTFDVLVPFELAEKPYDELKEGPGKLVLLADDNSKYSKLFSILLEKIHVEVVHAKDEQEVFSFLAKKNIDLMIINVRMADLKGYDIIRTVRERERLLSKHTPVIAFTEHINKSDKKACELVGVEELITKPLSKKVLRDLLLTY